MPHLSDAPREAQSAGQPVASESAQYSGACVVRLGQDILPGTPLQRVRQLSPGQPRRKNDDDGDRQGHGQVANDRRQGSDHPDHVPVDAHAPDVDDEKEKNEYPTPPGVDAAPVLVALIGGFVQRREDSVGRQAQIDVGMSVGR